jgi:hypothetical protein
MIGILDKYSGLFLDILGGFDEIAAETQEKQMLGQEQMRFAAQTMAAIFGGPGIFYVYLSFYKPYEAITGLIYLSIATALALYADRTGETRPLLARAKAVFRGKRRS